MFTTPATVVPTPTIVISSILEPEAPAVKMVVMFVGAVNEVSRVAFTSPLPVFTVAANAGLVANLLSPYRNCCLKNICEPALAVGSIPVTPVVRGKPVVLVSTPAEGVPILGVTKVGEVSTTNFVPVPV